MQCTNITFTKELLFCFRGSTLNLKNKNKFQSYKLQ